MLPIPEFPYSIREIRSLCQVIGMVARVVSLNDHRVTVHRIIADAVSGGITSGFHTHSVYEGIILLKGRAEYTTETRQELGPAHALMLPPFVKHSWRVLDASPCVRLTFEFSIDPPMIVRIPPHWPSWPELLWDVYLLLSDASRSQPNRHILIQTRLAAIFSRLLTLAEWPSCPLPEDEAPPMQFVDVVQTFLAENLAHPLTVADVAYHVGMSERSLIRHFRQLAGETVVQRLFKLRMDRAAGLLADTNTPVSTIGALVGIPDPAYFCSRFRHYFHQTPQQYRKNATTLPSMHAGTEG